MYCNGITLLFLMIYMLQALQSALWYRMQTFFLWILEKTRTILHIYSGWNILDENITTLHHLFLQNLFPKCLPFVTHVNAQHTWNEHWLQDYKVAKMLHSYITINIYILNKLWHAKSQAQTFNQTFIFFDTSGHFKTLVKLNEYY